jgi:hypothetical protein
MVVEQFIDDERPDEIIDLTFDESIAILRGVRDTSRIDELVNAPFADGCQRRVQVGFEPRVSEDALANE